MGSSWDIRSLVCEFPHAEKCGKSESEGGTENDVLVVG